MLASNRLRDPLKLGQMDNQLLWGLLTLTLGGRIGRNRGT